MASLYIWVWRVSPPPPSVFKYSICVRFRDIVHVSEMLCTCQRCCARFTNPLITFVFNCIHTERILISKSIGATKHVLPICIHIYIYIYIYIPTYINSTWKPNAGNWLIGEQTMGMHWPQPRQVEKHTHLAWPWQPKCPSPRNFVNFPLSQPKWISRFDLKIDWMPNMLKAYCKWT